MKRNLSNKKPQRVLVFNRQKKLIIICQSITAAAGAFKTSSTNIHFACIGKTISCCGLYFRHLKDEIAVTEEDLGTLSLEEYDQLCGEERTYYKGRFFERSEIQTPKQQKIDNED